MVMCGNDKTLQRKKKFLLGYADAGTISEACEKAGISRETYYRWREQDSEFVHGCKLAIESFVNRLEREAFRRAHEGWDEPVYYKGELQGTIRKYSDTLLIFLLKGAAPEKYRDNHVEITGKGGGPVQIETTPGELTDAELAVIAASNILRNNAGAGRARATEAETGA